MCGRCLGREASNVHLTKLRSVSLIRCLPKMSPSSTSTGSQIATWRRSLTRTRHEFSYDLRPPSTGKMFVWPPAFLSEPGSAPYSSAPSLTTVWSNYQISYNQQSAMMETDAGTCASISVSLSTTSSRLSNHFLLYTPIDLQFRLYQQSNQTSHSDQPNWSAQSLNVNHVTSHSSFSLVNRLQLMYTVMVIISM